MPRSSKEVPRFSIQETYRRASLTSSVKGGASVGKPCTATKEPFVLNSAVSSQPLMANKLRSLSGRDVL